MAHSLEDWLYEKYRVFKEPDDVYEHPAQVQCIYLSTGLLADGDDVWYPMEEVQDFFFVLKPDTDKYALIALKTYAALVEEEYPQLSQDLLSALSAY
jgi:hypothetical protein